MGTTFNDDNVVAKTFPNIDNDFQRKYLVKNEVELSQPYAPETKRRGHFSFLSWSGSSSKEQKWLVAFPIDLSRGWDVKEAFIV